MLNVSYSTVPRRLPVHDHGMNTPKEMPHAHSKEKSITREKQKRVRDLAIATDHSRTHTATGVLRRMEMPVEDTNIPHRLKHFGMKKP
jgi:hypothetical protein